MGATFAAPGEKGNLPCTTALRYSAGLTDAGANMIIESALLTIRGGSEPAFEAAFPAAVKFLAASSGYIDHTLRRSVETPTRYLLTVQWRTLEDHTEGFRGSAAFASWRAVIGPFFGAPPVVEHFRDL
jgi:heme-degrading monooxygenase HmoA